MCGIIGCVSSLQSNIPDGVEIMLGGLERLSYRGYDSAGIAVLEENRIKVIKRKGKVAPLAEEVKRVGLQSCIGIAHTRWATHGEPSDKNAHPHLDCKGHIACVHNGIIENYLPLRRHLQQQGHTLLSDTDSEVIVHLVEEHYTGNLEEAVREAIQRLIGSFALVALSQHHPHSLIVARKDCPLIIGCGQGGNFVASDIPVLLSYTKKFIILENGEMAKISVDGVSVSNFSGDKVSKDIQQIEWENGKVDKGGYSHFMLKEIEEQPKSILDTMRGRLNSDGLVKLEGIEFPAGFLSNLQRIYIVACGTAYHAAMIGEHIFEDLLRIPVEVDLASEFRYRNPILDKRSLVIAISQSGETADTLASIAEAQARGSRVLAIVNVVSSTMSRQADWTLHTRAGAEVAVASTKAFTAQQIALFLLALRFSQHAGRIAGGIMEDIAHSLMALPAQVQSILDNSKPVLELCRWLASKDTGNNSGFRFNDCFFIGRGLDDPIAREGALKLREISYINAVAYAAGELKHGNIALITPESPVIALLTQDRVRGKMVSNIMEVIARQAPVIAVAYEDDGQIAEVIPPIADLPSQIIRIPRTIAWLAPILASIPLQLIAYYTGINRGCDVDQPRNLAKSVTVE